MVNLRNRIPAVKSNVTKRTSSRTSSDSPSKTGNKYEEISIDSDDNEDIILEDSEPEASKPSSESDVLEGYASTFSNSEDNEDNSDKQDEEDLESDGSEDDKEIRRIIEKTEAETRNIPLTARQRAKLDGTGPTDPAENSTTTALTDEQALRKSEKSRRRKLQRDAKIEETKRATIDRLLQKQKKTPVSAVVDENEIGNKSEESGLQTGYMRFIEKNDCTILQFPDEGTFQAALSDMTRSPRLCAESLCQICQKEPSKYVHPRNGKLFCSSSCYKLIK